MKKKIALPASFLMPLVIAVAICIRHEVFPFGEQCILHIDMYHQYCPFFTELMEKIRTGGSFFYSWNVGLGADFVSLYAYYLASPLNWLIALCPADAVIEFMTILVILKIALCGLTFAFYLKAHFRTDCFAVSVFGTAYALSAFMAAYAWNIMWTDCLVLAPLVISGVERLVKEGKTHLYFISLAVSILSNYYISIMICIFASMWFLICWLENRETGVRAWFRFAWCSLLAGGAGAVLMVPTAIVLGYSGAQGISFPRALEWYFHVLPELARHCVLTEPYTGTEHWPNLYCGAFVPVLSVLYLLNREISWKKKLSRLLPAVFFVVSFSCNLLDFFWHGLHFPTSLPGRQSFLYIFLLLSVAFDAFLHLSGSRVWHVVAAGAADVLWLLAAYRMTDASVVSAQAFTFTVVFIECYLVLAAGYLAGNQKLKRLMMAVACFSVLSELMINFEATGLDVTNRTSYVAARADYKAVCAAAEEDMEREGVLFYRTEELERKTKNDAPLFGYRSATQFSSLMNLNVSHFYQNVGMEGGKNFYCINGATPLLSAMLSVRYVLADNPMEEGPLRTMAASSGETYLYENTCVLPLGFVMDEEVISSWNLEGAGDIASQNELAYLLGAKTAMLTETASVSSPGESVVEIQKDGYYYAVYDKTSVSNLTVEVSDGRTRSFSKVSHGYTLDLGYCRAGLTVRIKNGDGEQLNVTAYYLDQEAMETAFRALNEQTMTMTSFSDTGITGEIEIRRAGRLIFSIAAEDGWTLFVDGEKVEPELFGGAFISTYLPEGHHKIRLSYRTPGFVSGALISAVSLALYLAVSLLLRVKKQKKCEVSVL